MPALTASRRPPWLRGFLACLVALVPLAGLTRAQTPAAKERVTWELVIDAYLEGRDGDAARLLEIEPDEAARLAHEALEVWTERARSTGPQARDERRLTLRRLQASALLPLEVLLPVSSRMASGEALAPLERVARDAWERLAEFDTPGLDLPGDPERPKRAEQRLRFERFRVRWQVAFLQLQVNLGRITEARALAPRIKLSKGDPSAAQVYFLRGLAEEAAARLVDDSTLTRRTASNMPTPRLRALEERLARAADWYRRALGAQSTFDEARLRLGRVRLEAGEPRQAIETLAGLMAPMCTSARCGLAWLFAAEAYEAQRHWGDAASAYARASSVLEVRQSALMALTQLALRRGDTRQAAELTSQFRASAPLARLDRPDAWTLHLASRRQDSEAVLAPTREAVVP